MDSKGRRRSSASKLDTENLARLQQLKFLNHGGAIASKLFKMKAPTNESAAAALSLSKVMARKKPEPVSLQIEIETEMQWKLLLRRDGLIVVEVYAGWCGPCLSMVSILKKVKVDANDDRLTLATVNSDNISDLHIFKGQSEPAWIFFGGGKPVKLLRGANSARIVATIKSEFQHELLCMEGKAKRNLISIKDEADRKKKAEDEAIQLAIVKKQEPEAEVNEEPKEKNVSLDEYAEFLDNEEEKEETTEDPGNVIVDEINTRLMTSLESFTVLAIQGFLLETGAVTEIKDLLRPDFEIVRERYIFLDEDGVRDLFGIPYELPELIEEEEKPEQDEEENDNLSEVFEEGQEPTSLSDVISVKTELQVKSVASDGKKLGSEVGEGNEEREEGEFEDLEEEERVVVPKYRMVPLPLPNELVGDTLLFMLESIAVKSQKELDPETPIVRTADDHLRSKVGPDNYQDALDQEPKSLHAVYGREEYAAGVWCPKKYDDKKYVMLNFFPQFVTEMLMPPPKECPKYKLAIFPALFSNEIMDHPELVNNKKDVVAQGKISLPVKLVDRMLKSRGVLGDELEAQKKALTGFDMFAVSIDERNELLAQTVESLEPIHYSTSNDNGRFETAKLFPYLNILVDDDFEEEDVYRRDLIIEKFLSRPGPKLRLSAILDDDYLITMDDVEGNATSPVVMDEENNDNHSTPNHDGPHVEE